MSEEKKPSLKHSFRSQRSPESLCDVRPDVLTRLKCKECDGYLSCAPVYLTKDGQAICGKCAPGEDCYRNTTFEILAEMMTFPCANQRHGCRLSIPFLNNTHETACEYRHYMCPLISTLSCEWLGPGYKLLDHCNSEHQDIILSNPCELQYDIGTNNLKNYFMLTFGMLFLIHVKVSVNLKKIYHSIRLIGDPRKAGLFNFNLDIENRGVLMNKTGIVVEQGCMTIQEKYCTSVSFSALQEFLGNYEGTVFKIKINKITLSVECNNCQTVVQVAADNNNKIIYCETCMHTQILCENSNLGCTYKDIRPKTEKHKRYFCKFTTRCLICKNEVNKALELHYMETKTIYRAGTTAWLAYRENSLQWCVVKSLIGILICAYRTMGNTFKLYICSLLNSDQLSDYRCSMVLANPASGHSVTKQMDVKVDEIFDWKSQIADQQFLDVVDNDCFYVTVELSKK